MTLTYYCLFGLAVVAMVVGSDATAQVEQNPTSLDNLKRAQSCEGSIPRFGFRQSYTSGGDHHHEQ